ncbi:MAG TPA: hypothetical protein VK660_08615 [Xanthomonadaceae bacterium]|jgi:hypothetical protein|nr:hypothetical protein [Xanthomonadaceae bacterium]
MNLKTPLHRATGRDSKATKPVLKKSAFFPLWPWGPSLAITHFAEFRILEAAGKAAASGNSFSKTITYA